MRTPKRVTEREAKLAAEVRLHKRYNALVVDLDALRGKLESASGNESERRIMALICELEIELESVKSMLSSES